MEDLGRYMLDDLVITCEETLDDSIIMKMLSGTGTCRNHGSSMGRVEEGPRSAL